MPKTLCDWCGHRANVNDMGRCDACEEIARREAIDGDADRRNTALRVSGFASVEEETRVRDDEGRAS